MNTFHYSIEQPALAESKKIAEYARISVLYASVKPISAVRLVGKYITEEDVLVTVRPDIAEAQKDYPYKHHISFQSRHTIRTWLANNDQSEIIAQVFHPDKTHDLVLIPICKYAWREYKEAKFDKIASILRCPSCGGAVNRDQKSFECLLCGERYAHTGNSVNFLTEKLRTDFSIVTTANVSDWGYDERVTEAVTANPDKLFLDVGAGFKYTCYENVINLEIVDYPSTDVLGVGEKLPFTDGAFDGIISLVVLEHVKDPFACAREMMRVLKPGGELFCSAPFLQPFHGYPHHYYNMTFKGLAALFSGMEIKTHDIPPYLHPMAAITWIMNSYASGLPEALQKQFLSMSIEELLATFSNGINPDHPLRTELPMKWQFGIACGTFIHAVKPLIPLV